jgi:hypothetical protein
MPDSPHFAYPIRVSASGIATTEDGSDDEMVSIALYALRTPLRHRSEALDFGMNDVTFKRRPEPIVTAAILRADERIATLPSEERDEFTSRILEQVSSEQ